MGVLGKPTVTALVVNYNGKGVVEKCVSSVLKSKYPNLIVVVVDNGSKDGSIDSLRRRFQTNKRFRLLELGRNVGPAMARNLAMGKIKSKYVAFLDNDTQVRIDWLTDPIRLMEADKKIASVQCKLVLGYDHKKLDYVGDYISQFGFLVQRSQTGEEDEGQFDQIVDILSAKSAGMLLRKKAFDVVGGFDPDFFIYVEETDLGWRFWLKGYKNVFCPTSTVYHEYGTTAKRYPAEQNYRAKFHGSKNYVATLFKCLGSRSLLMILPIHISLWFAMSAWFFAKGSYKNSWWIIKGILWNLINLFSLLKKRYIIQKSRLVSDEELFKKIMVKKDISYFYQKLVGTPNLKGVKGYSQK